MFNLTIKSSSIKKSKAQYSSHLPSIPLDSVDKLLLSDCLEESDHLLNLLKVRDVSQIPNEWYFVFSVYLKKSEQTIFTYSELETYVESFIAQSRNPVAPKDLMKWDLMRLTGWMISRPHVFYVLNIPSWDKVSQVKARQALSYIQSIAKFTRGMLPANVIDQQILRCIS